MKRRNLFKSLLFLRIVLLVGLFVILLLGGFTYKHISNLTNSTNLVVRNYEVNFELEHINSYLNDVENGHRKYTLTKDTSYLKPYLNARENINDYFIQLNELTKEDAKQQENLRILNKLVDSLFSNFSKTDALVKIDEVNTETFKTLFFKEKIVLDSIRNKIKEIIDIENELFNARQLEYQSNFRFTPFFFYFVLLATLVIIILAFNKINLDLIKIKAKNDQLLIFKESSNQSEIIGKYGNWVWHIDSNIYTYSDNLYRLLGEEPQSFEASYNNFLKLVHPEDVHKFTKGLEKMTDKEELPFINYRIIQKNGLIKYLKSYGKAFYSDNGQKRLLGITSDITEEIENLIKLEERNLELERNNKELAAFNYAASHDLQEPLRKIQTFISRFEEREAYKLSDSGLEYLERIKSAATRMRLLIDDLLQFSISKKPDKELVVSNLNMLFESAKQDVALTIQEKKAQITNDTLPTASVIAFQIQQLFLNLLSNALKYSKNGGVVIIKVKYTMVRARDEHQLRKATNINYHKITFTDNGIGFDQKYAEKIFNLFNRLHNKQDYSGTGVGLSICKKIIENHKGFIFAKGEINVGSVFTVYLPI